ncbi:MAG: cadherin-like beta sandwich domain-containing protein [Clostridia bacterium]
MKNRKIIIGMLLSVLIIMCTLSVEAVAKNNNPLLREITIDGEAIKSGFDQFITDYVIAVDSSKENIEIEAITDDPNASYEIKGDTNLNLGINNFEIKVTAEDEKTTNSYFLHITKGDINKANANLKNIEIEGLLLNPKFNEKDTNYLVEYDNYIEKLNIIATPESEKAKIEILDNDNFNSTIHIVTIKVTAEDGITTKEYKINAKKAGESIEDPSGLEQYEESIEQKQEAEQEVKNKRMWIGIGVVGIIVIIGIVIIIKKKK